MPSRRKPAISPVEFKTAMRRLAAGVTIVATAGRQGRAGLTATAVCSLSADPPRLLVCVNRDSAPNGAIARAKRFSVNVLATRHKALALRFAGATGVQGEERFAKGEWREGVTGAPLLADALASFDCRLLDAVESGTHTIFIGDVREAHATPAGAPLVYAAGAFQALARKTARKSGRRQRK
jgi:flavin reductase (DIM6/NTAB) family NADH-FMN oxidoreductase RutF